MNKIKYILLILITCSVYSCTSDGTSNVKRIAKIDYSDMTMYAGPPTGTGGRLVEYDKDIQNKDSLRFRLMNKHFGGFFSADKRYHELRSIEFADARVTYKNENITLWDAEDDKIRQIVSTYEFVNDSLFIDRTSSSPYFVATRTQSGDTLVVTRGFSSYPPSTGAPRVHKDSAQIIDKNIVLKYSKYTDISQMVNGDTMLWCNVRYLFY